MDKLISAQAVLDIWRQMICYDRMCHYRDEGRCTETFCDFKLFEYQINHMPSARDKRKGMTDQTLKDIDRAFKALEERDELLNKLRAEIETLNPVDYVSMSSYEGHKGASDMKDDVLQIIDKYKAESEVKI